MENKLSQFDEFLNGLAEGVNRGGFPEIIYYSKSNRYIVWKTRIHYRGLALGDGKNGYAKPPYRVSYTLADLKNWKSRLDSWKGYGLGYITNNAIFYSIGDGINKIIIKDWEEKIGEKLIKVKINNSAKRIRNHNLPKEKDCLFSLNICMGSVKRVL